MFMIPDKNRIATVMHSRKAKLPSGDVAVERSDTPVDNTPGCEECVQRLFTAFEQKDVKSAVSAMKELFAYFEAQDDKDEAGAEKME